MIKIGMAKFLRAFAALTLLCGGCPAALRAQTPSTLPSATPPAVAPVKVKVVILAMFERGEDTGDIPGEYQFWVERDKLDQIIPMPAGYHHVRMNKDGELGVLTGVGTAR